MSYEMCLDVGGTFTDLYIRDDNGNTDSFKTSTTPEHITEGLFNVFKKAANDYGMTVDQLLDNTVRITHGTTTATNAIIEEETAKTALLTTAGHESALWLREGDLQNRQNPYHWDVDYQDPYIPLSLTYGIEERINSRGEVHTELNEARVIEVIEDLKSRDVESVAVALLWAHINSVHEQRTAELIEEHAPTLHYSLSHKVNPIIREYRRMVSTAIDASIYHLVEDYLRNFNDELCNSGFKNEPLIVAANGGVMGIDEIVETPIWTVDSGPTMLPIAALHFTEEVLDEDNVIAVDMGGTSLDMSVIKDGTIARTREAEIGADILGIEKVHVESIGAGGGSVAWVDEGGLLRIGPKSAGADPGPACYLRGGEGATVTDAAMALGYLSENHFLGGDMDVSQQVAREIIGKEVADPLGLSIDEAARSVYTSATQNMVQGIQGVTIERGIDPRKFVMSGGGGALGTFIIDVARELQIEHIVLPTEAGVVSSIGGVVSNLRRDFSKSYSTTASQFETEQVNNVLSSLEERAKNFFDRTEIPEEDHQLQFITEARYPHQVWELEVEIPGKRIKGGQVEEVVKRFHSALEEMYGFSADQDVEFLYWRVEATGLTEDVDLEREKGSSELEAVSEREAVFDGTRTTTPAYHDEDLAPGHSVTGPAFVDGNSTTIVLPPDSNLKVTKYGAYHLTP